MGPRADLDVLGVGKNLLPLLGIKPQLSSPQPTHYIDYAILGPFFIRKPMGRAKYILKINDF
jgi:hypothetical protein